MSEVSRKRDETRDEGSGQLGHILVATEGITACPCLIFMTRLSWRFHLALECTDTMLTIHTVMELDLVVDP